MRNILIHVPHSSLFIPEEYKNASLLTQDEIEEENQFMCDTGIVGLIPPAFRENALIFPYSRLYCDVERFRSGNEPMERYGMGYIYTHDSRGRRMFEPTKAHRCEVDMIYEAHHSNLDRRVSEILGSCGSCIIIDLHSYSDEAVARIFGFKNCPDVCIGIEEDYYSECLVRGIVEICRAAGLSTDINYPYKGSIVPNSYYGQKNTGITSVMIEINKRILGKIKEVALQATIPASRQSILHYEGV